MLKSSKTSNSILGMQMQTAIILVLLTSMAFIGGIMFGRSSDISEISETIPPYNLPRQASGYDAEAYLWTNSPSIEHEVRGFFRAKPGSWVARNLLEQFIKLSAIADQSGFTFNTAPCSVNHLGDVYIGSVYLTSYKQDMCFEKISRNSELAPEDQYGALLLVQTNMTSAFELYVVSKESWPLGYRYDGETNGYMYVEGGTNMDITMGNDITKLFFRDSHNTYKQVIQSLPITENEWDDLAPYFPIVQWHE